MARAVRFVVERLAENPAASRLALIDEAARRFDLSPLETDALMRRLASPEPRRPPEGPSPA